MKRIPRGIRQNNPGNLRHWKGWYWQGEREPIDGYCVFDSPANGLRAMCKNLVAYYERHKLDTVRGIITRWAPPNENKTQAYIAAVAKRLEVEPDTVLLVDYPPILAALCRAIVHHENGQQPYSDKQIEAAVNAALNLRSSGPIDSLSPTAI